MEKSVSFGLCEVVESARTKLNEFITKWWIFKVEGIKIQDLHFKKRRTTEEEEEIKIEQEQENKGIEKEGIISYSIEGNDWILIATDGFINVAKQIELLERLT